MPRIPVWLNDGEPGAGCEFCELRMRRRESLRGVLLIIGRDLKREGILRQRKEMLEDLAAGGDEAAAQEWWELFGGV